VARLDEIAEAVGTPVYVYDADVFRDRIARLEQALDGVPHQVCYALKANDALALVAVAAQAELGADIVSRGELDKALRGGIAPERIVFSGVGKRRDEIRAALEAGIRSLNVESLGELAVVTEEARALGAVAPVSFRVNPDVVPDTHTYVSTGSATSKFGLSPPEALEAARRAAAEPALEPIGLSFHVGSQLLDPGPIFAAADRVAEIWRELAAEGLRLRDLDAGGGLGVSYSGRGEPDVEEYVEALARVAQSLGAVLLLEPGRWLVARAGTFVTRVLYVKERRDRRIAVCDGGMNDLIRPALYDAYHPIALVGEAEGRPRGVVDVVGPVCESGDFFALGRDLPLPEPGDLLAVELAGAYGRVMSSTYNARPLCAEVLVEDGRWHVTREAGSAADLLRGEPPG
jgi:diaminopimelate decarboxylase